MSRTGGEAEATLPPHRVWNVSPMWTDASGEPHLRVAIVVGSIHFGWGALAFAGVGRSARAPNQPASQENEFSVRSQSGRSPLPPVRSPPSSRLP